MRVRPSLRFDALDTRPVIREKLTVQSGSNIKTMADNKAASTSTPPKTETKKRKLAKTLEKFTPFVKWHTGLVICGKIIRKFENSGSYGVKSNLEIELLDAASFTNGDGEETTVEVGNHLNVGHVAGLNSAMTLDPGVTVQIECTGKKILDKGRKPAWEFDVDYE